MWIGGNTKILKNLKYHKTEIESVSDFKYLGHVIDEKLNGKNHLAHIESKVGPMLNIANGLKTKLSIEKLTQLIYTYIYPVATYGWKTMYPLMGKVSQGKWDDLVHTLQKRAINAPSNAKTSIIKQISRIPTLDQTMKKRSIDQIIPIISGKTNSMIQKLELNEPDPKKRRKNQYTAKTSAKKSAITEISETINSAKISKKSYGSLFDNYRPKIKSQILNPSLKKCDREAIKNLALGSLTRDIMSKCDNKILHYCIHCSKNPKIVYKHRETVGHFLMCNTNWDQLKKQSNEVNTLMDQAIERKLKDLKLRRALNQCKKYENYTVYNDVVDAILGIGKIQVFSNTATKKMLKKVENLVYKMQDSVIIILRSKNRLGGNYHDRLNSLLSEQP